MTCSGPFVTEAAVWGHPTANHLLSDCSPPDPRHFVEPQCSSD